MSHVFKIGDRVADVTAPSWRGTVKAFPGPGLISVDWDDDPNHECWYRLKDNRMIPLDAEEDQKRIPDWRLYGCSCGAVSGGRCRPTANHTRGVRASGKVANSTPWRTRGKIPDPYAKCQEADNEPLLQMHAARNYVLSAFDMAKAAITGSKRVITPSKEPQTMQDCVRDMRPVLAEIEALLKRLDPK